MDNKLWFNLLSNDLNVMIISYIKVKNIKILSSSFNIKYDFNLLLKYKYVYILGCKHIRRIYLLGDRYN